MRVQKDAGAVGTQLLDDVAHEQTTEWIETGRRLVEKHELRRAHDRLREPRALRHALAVGAQRPMRRVLEANAQKQRFDMRIEPALRQPEQAPMKMQQLARVQAIVKAEMLGQETDALAHLGVAERRA